LVLLLVVAVLVVLSRPQLLVNDRFLPFGARMATKAGVSLQWRQGHIEIESPGLLEKRIHLDFTDLCVRMPSQGVDACFDHAKVTVAGGLIHWKFKITEIGPADILGKKVVYALKDSKSEPETEKPQDAKKGEIFPKFLSDAQVFPLQVRLPQWKFEMGDTALTGQLDLDSRTAANGDARIKLDAEAAMASWSSGRQQFEAKALLENPHGFFEMGGWKLGLDAKARLADGSRANAHAKLDPRKGPLAYAYRINADLVRGKLRVNADLAGDLAPDELTARINADAHDLVPALTHAWIKGCKLKLSRVGSETRPGALKMDCPVYAEVPVPPAGFPKVSLPAEAGVHVVADLRSGVFPPTADAMVDGKVSLELDPILSPIFGGGGKVESQIAGVPSKFPAGWKMDTDLGLRLRITSFEHLVKKLSNTPYDVWAPLRVLTGHVDVALQGRFDANSGTAPVQFSTRLASEKQVLNIDAGGQLRIERLRPSPKMDLTMDVMLTEVKLELPPLPELPRAGDISPDPFPRLFPDNRYVSPETKVNERQKAGIAEEPMFTYDVRIRTLGEGRPVKLVASQVKDPIPLGVDLALQSDKPVSGGIKIQSFPIQLFKRDVNFEHLTVSLRQPSKDSVLDGKIVVPYTQYTVTILILGTTDKPQIKFLSDPPLPDDQIIAALIFGKPIDALDPDQQQSVGSTRAALRQGALSLFALRYLGSLNIESIDYDPGTKTASLRYTLAEGTTLNVSQGTGGGQPSAGIRKRLSKHFAVTTTLNNPSPTHADRTVSTFLEWAYQY
jgi:hypothetical protein